MTVSRGTTYRVYITPRTDIAEYGDEVEVTDRVELRGIKQITRSIDSEDYSFGVYAFNDVSMDCDNYDGYFADPSDSRSFFKYSRDLAKVRVVYFKDDVETTTFRGLVVDEGSRDNLETDTLTLRVLGRDSAIRKTKIIPGAVTDGTSISDAIFNILNREEITSVLTVDESNINVDQDGTVDDGTALDNKPTKDILDQLLIASNSVLLINSDDEIIVQSREHDSVADPLELFGKGDLKSRENIINIQNYNNGLQRLFNSVQISDVVQTNEASTVTYGTRKKTFDFEWLTDTANITTLAARVLREFQFPKIEFEVTVATDIAKGYDLLDRVSVNYPLVITPTGPFLPICGITVCGDANSPLPRIRGAVRIRPNYGFKIIEITENVQDFTTRLKLRQIGVTTNDGFL